MTPATPPPFRPSSVRHLLRTLATSVLAGIAALLAWILFEALFWTFPDLMPIDVQRQLEVLSFASGDEVLYEHDDVLEHRARPGVRSHVEHIEGPFDVETVSLPGLPLWGWRSAPFDAARPFSALVLGDSFAFGYGVAKEESLAGLLDAHYRRLGGQAFSAGLSNLTGTLQYELILERILERHRPGEVLILHYENDYFDSYLFKVWQQVRSLAPGRQTEYPNSRSLFGFLNDRNRTPRRDPSTFLRGPRIALNGTSVAWNLAKRALGRPPYDNQTFSRRRFAGAEYLIDAAGGASTGAVDPRAELGCGLTEQALTRMIGRLQASEIPVTIFMIPAKGTLVLAGDLNRRPAVEESTRCRSRVIETCRRHGARVVDPFEAWVPLVRQKQLYFPLDPHWTRDGHRAAFECLDVGALV